MQVNGANAEAIQAWDGVLFEKFSRFRAVITAGLSVHGTEALRKVRKSLTARARSPRAFGM
jgi:hypothetical protein